MRLFGDCTVFERLAASSDDGDALFGGQIGVGAIEQYGSPHDADEVCVEGFGEPIGGGFPVGALLFGESDLDEFVLGEQVADVFEDGVGHAGLADGGPCLQALADSAKMAFLFAGKFHRYLMGAGGSRIVHEAGPWVHRVRFVTCDWETLAQGAGGVRKSLRLLSMAGQRLTAEIGRLHAGQGIDMTLRSVVGGLLPAVWVHRGAFSFRTLRRDVAAGLTVGVVALPLAMAFAIACGLGPERGLYTAIIAGALISMFSGSRVQIGGPTGAFVVVIAGVLTRHGYEGLAVATLLAGLLLLLMAVVGLGELIRFIPYPVTTGFTTGIAVIIFSTQVKDLLGLHVTDVPAGFLGKWAAYASADAVSGWSLAVGLGSLAGLAFLRRFFPRLPGALLVVALAGVLVAAADLPVETIGTRFGEVPRMLPAPHWPSVGLEQLRAVFPDALTLAILAAIESLLSCVVADGMTGDRHRPNAELLGQGLANMAAVVFGGIPATGAIARTATNIRAGAATPIAGVIHAVTLLGILLLAGPWAARIPLPALAAVLVMVAWSMSEVDRFRDLFRAPRSDTAVMLCTFLLTVLVDLNVAIQMGLLLAALLFMRRMVAVGAMGPMDYLDQESVSPTLMARRLALPDVEVYEIAGPFFFGVADRLKRVLEGIERPPCVFILRIRHVPAIDATGLYALDVFFERCRRRGTTLVLSGVQPQPAKALGKCGLLDRIGPANICGSIDVAFDRAETVLAEDHTPGLASD